MELSKYNKLEKLGFTFWIKKQDADTGFQSYLIGESFIAISSSASSNMSLNERERFINSVARFLSEETVKKINIEELTKQDIKTAFLFNCPKMKTFQEDDIKILSYPSINNICSSITAKKEFFIQFKEDLVI